jgi:hypothetical protein
MSSGRLAGGFDGMFGISGDESEYRISDFLDASSFSKKCGAN